MSLISEALKEAQRERSGRAAPRGPASLGDGFFPYPTARQTSRAPSRGVLIGVAAFAVIAVGGAVAARVYLKRPARPANSGITTLRPPAAPSAAQSAAQPITRTAAAPAVPAGNAAQKNTDAAPRVATPAPGNVARAPQSERSIPISGAAKTVASAPPQTQVPIQSPAAPTRDSVVSRPPAAPAVLPAADAGIRVVVNSPTLRPGDSLFARAYQEHARGNLIGAQDLYERALARPPVSPELYNNYGALLAERRSFAAAITMYKRGIQENADDARIWSNLGDAYNASGQRAEAVGAYFEAAKRDPQNAIVKVRLAGEYIAIGDTASARRNFDDAIRVGPKVPEAHYEYAKFLQAQRDYRGALREYDAFLTVAPGRIAPEKIEEIRVYVAGFRRRFP